MRNGSNFYLLKYEGVKRTDVHSIYKYTHTHVELAGYKMIDVNNLINSFTGC